LRLAESVENGGTRIVPGQRPARAGLVLHQLIVRLEL
jgi:hypothetical protein